MDAKTIASRGYEPYLEAAWGLKNHWYPAAFSHEVPDKLVKGVMIAGREIALRRARGKVHALADRCAHRGVRMSKKSTCLTDEHLTCWYDGFSYGLEDGLLKTIVGSPEDPRIGKIAIRTYPVEEFNGVIYVFIGDPEYKPLPPLDSDLPIRITDEPDAVGHLLDQNVYLRGIHRTAACNWRLAMENGFDSGHPLIHYDTALIAATDRALGLGWAPTAPEAVRIIDAPDGPKGMMNMFRTGQFRVVRENALTGIKVHGQSRHYARTSIYLPCCLLVENWPIKGWGQYEWCVPIDDQRHEYWEVLVGPGATDEEIKESEFKFVNFLEPLGLWGFNDPDVFAREAVQEFYAKMDGWERERLCQFDSVLVGWRKLVSQYNRGIASPPQASA
ncbi:MAG: Rieske 2Fe-2S domain-containing protein [Candidatus Binataceae bacterium]